MRKARIIQLGHAFALAVAVRTHARFFPTTGQLVIDGRRTMEEVALSVASAMDGGGDLAELSGLFSDEELQQLQGGPTGFAVHCSRLQPVIFFWYKSSLWISAN